MIVEFKKVEPNCIYSKVFFCFLPRFYQGKIFWLSLVHREIYFEGDKLVTKYSKGYDGGVVYFFISNKTVEWLNFSNFLLGKNLIKISF